MQTMLQTFRDRREQEEGFTLIELMVVVLIIAILIAIAIPTFLGARERAQDRAAQSSDRNALVAAKTIFTDNATYAEALTSAQLEAVEPSLDYVATGVKSSGPKEISVGATATTWGGAVLSDSGDCFMILEVSTAGTTFGTTTEANCTGTYVLANPPAADGW